MLRQSAASSMESTRSSARSLMGCSERAGSSSTACRRSTHDTNGRGIRRTSRTTSSRRSRTSTRSSRPSGSWWRIESSRIPSWPKVAPARWPTSGQANRAGARLDLPIVSGQDIRYRCGRCGSAFCVCASISPSTIQSNWTSIYRGFSAWVAPSGGKGLLVEPHGRPAGLESVFLSRTEDDFTFAVVNVGPPLAPVPIAVELDERAAGSTVELRDPGGQHEGHHLPSHERDGRLDFELADLGEGEVRVVRLRSGKG